MRGGIPNIPQCHSMTFRNQTLTGPAFWTASLVCTASLYCHVGMITIVSPNDENGATAGRECQPRRRDGSDRPVSRAMPWSSSPVRTFATHQTVCLRALKVKMEPDTSGRSEEHT